MYEPIERRKAFQELWDKVTEFIAKSEQCNSQTEEWRIEVKLTLKEIAERLNEFPCKERSGKYDNIKELFEINLKNIYRHIAWIWTLIVLIISILIKIEFKK
jgi:hypothetical protein